MRVRGGGRRGILGKVRRKEVCTTRAFFSVPVPRHAPRKKVPSFRVAVVPTCLPRFRVAGVPTFPPRSGVAVVPTLQYCGIQQRGNVEGMLPRCCNPWITAAREQSSAGGREERMLRAVWLPMPALASCAWFRKRARVRMELLLFTRKSARKSGHTEWCCTVS